MATEVAPQRGPEPDVIELLHSDSEEEDRTRFTSNAGAGPSCTSQRQRQQHLQQRQHKRGSDMVGNILQQRRRQPDDYVDLTGPAPDLGDVQIVNVTAPKRPRRQPLSPGKAALLAQLLVAQQGHAVPVPAPEASPPRHTCGICMEQMGGEGRTMAAGNCGHTYCRECLLAAVKTQHKCPTCRKPMKANQVRNIFIS